MYTHTRLAITGLVCLLVSCNCLTAFCWEQSGNEEPSNSKWRSQVVGVILGPTRTDAYSGNSSDEVSELPAPPTFREIHMLIEEKGAKKFGLPVDAELQNAKLKLVENWIDPEKEYPLIGPAQLQHRLYLCTLQYKDRDAVKTRQFVIDHNSFITNPYTNIARAENKKDAWKPITKDQRRLNSYPKLRSYDDLNDSAIDSETHWPDFMQGAWLLKINWQDISDEKRVQVANSTKYEVLVSGSHLYLYHSKANYLIVYELLDCEDEPNGQGRRVCLTTVNGERRMVEISDTEFVFLSHGKYSMTGFTMTKLNPAMAEDDFQSIVRRTAFLIDGKVVRFCGEEIKEFESPLDYERDRNSLLKMHLEFGNADIRKVIWFQGTAAQEARLRRDLYGPSNRIDSN